MSWLKRTDQIVQLEKQKKKKLSFAEAGLFKTIKLEHKDGDPKLIEELDKNGYTVWAAYPADDPGKKSLAKIDTAGQRKYEIFCGVFLYYHDKIFKTKICHIKFSHDIYFEWFGQGENKKVRIYITKTPKDKNPNPPKPPAPPPPES